MRETGGMRAIDMYAWTWSLFSASPRLCARFLLFVSLCLCVRSSPAQTDSTIRVNASVVTNHITPYMTGSCIEDVNHEIYGGLYSQLIFGESFEEPPNRTVN